MQEHDDNLEIENTLAAEGEAPVAENTELTTAEVAEIEEYNGHPDFSPEEIEKAKADGWKEEDEKGLSPGEFNRNKPFFNKIKALKAEKTREVNELKREMAAIKAQQDAARREGYEAGLRALQAQRAEAIRYGNVDEFERIDQEVEQVRKNIQSIPLPTTTVTDQDALEFFRRNPWTEGDTPEHAIMVDAANSYEARLDAAQARKGLPPLSYADKAKQLEEYIHLKFPHKFQDEPVVAKAATAPAVSSGTSPRIKVGQDKPTISNLTDFQKTRFEVLKAADPTFTVEKYLAAMNQATRR